MEPPQAPTWGPRKAGSTPAPPPFICPTVRQRQDKTKTDHARLERTPRDRSCSHEWPPPLPLSTPHAALCRRACLQVSFPNREAPSFPLTPYRFDAPGFRAVGRRTRRHYSIVTHSASSRPSGLVTEVTRPASTAYRQALRLSTIPTHPYAERLGCGRERRSPSGSARGPPPGCRVHRRPPPAPDPLWQDGPHAQPW